MAEAELLSRYYLYTLLQTFDPQPGDAQLTYADLAKRCQARLWGGPPGATELVPDKDKPEKPHKPPPASGVSAADEERAIRETVSFFAPMPDDRSQDIDVIVGRLAGILDMILGRWTSGVEQPVGPSGGTVAGAG